MKTVVAAVALAVAAAFVPGQWLELHRDTELWRIVTCHFTHWTYEQLAWDALAFLALGVACARRNRAAVHATLFASALLVPLAVLAFAPNVTAYRGLSGLASAMFALLLTLEWRRLTWPVVVFAIAFAAKLIVEAISGGAVFAKDMGADVVAVPVAHLAGALVGVIGGLEKKRRAVVLTPLVLTSCVSIPLPLPRLSEKTCSTAQDLLGTWRSRRITQVGPVAVKLELRDDCRFVMRLDLPFGESREEGTYAVERDQLRLKRAKGETVWAYRRENGRLMLREGPNEWRTYNRSACASFWPCKSERRRPAG